MAKSPASASLTAVSSASAGRSHPLFRLTWKPVQKLECARAIERVGRPTLVAAGSRRADAPSARHGDRVGAGHEARRRLPLACELDQRAGELGGVTALAVVHGVPGSDGLSGAFSMVVGILARTVAPGKPRPAATTR